MSMAELVTRSNANRKNKIALDLRTSRNDFKVGVTITFKKFMEMINKVYAAGKMSGIEANEIVLSIMPNVPESRYVIYGLNKLGATIYPVSFTLSNNQLKEIIEKNNIKTAFVFEAFLPKFSEQLDNIEKVYVLTGKESLPWIMRIGAKKSYRKYNSWESFIQKGKKYQGDFSEFYYDPNHIAIIEGTSGTTGIPKGVCLTDDNLNAIAYIHRNAEFITDEEKVLDILFQGIAYGLSTMHYTTYMGCHNVIIPELLTDKFPKALYNIKGIQNFTGGPIHCRYLLDSEQLRDNGKLKINNFVSGGASLPIETELSLNEVTPDFEEKGIDKRIFVRQGFGATENCGCGLYAKQGAYKVGSIGIPLPLVVASIFNPGTDEELKYGETGEICITGPTVMAGYLNNETETRNVLKKHSDGLVWLHLGDMGYCDKDGRFFHVDRIKDIFMRKGFNVFPSKIEEYISTFAEVKECKVIGIENYEETEVPVAFVVRNDGTEDEKTLEDIFVRRCYENLDELYVPYSWKFVDTLPRNLGGKVLVDELKKLV